jgi:transposase
MALWRTSKNATRSREDHASHGLRRRQGGDAFVMFRDDASANTRCETWDKLLHMLRFNRQEFMRAYHKRSNVESTFSAIKRVCDFVRSRCRTAQVNEVLFKILCHNLRQVIFAMFELGIAPSFASETPDA